MSGDDKKNKVIHRGDTLESITPLDDVIVYAKGTEQSKKYKESVRAMDEALSLRSPLLTSVIATTDVMMGTVDDIDNFEDEINDILSKYGVSIDKIDELEDAKLSPKDKKKIEKILKKTFSNMTDDFSKAKSILEDDKSKNKYINKNLKKTAKDIKRYEKEHPQAKVRRLKKEYADALQILLLENKGDVAYKQAKKIVKEYHKLHKNGKYFSSQDVFVQPLSGVEDGVLGYYNGQHIYLREPRLDENGYLKESAFEQGNPIAVNQVLAHEANHKKDGEFAGANNLFFNEHSLMFERLTENLSKAAEYLYVAEQWTLCKNQGMEWFDFQNAAGWPSRVKVDNMLDLCPGLKETIGESGFNPEKEEDVKKVVNVAGKQWKNKFTTSYKQQGMENVQKNQGEVALQLLGRGLELMAKQNQYYDEVEKRMLSNVYTYYRTYDLSSYKDLLNPLSKEEALSWLSDSDKLITADMVEKINNYLDANNVSAKEKDAYFVIALSNILGTDKVNSEMVVDSLMDKKIVAGVEKIISSYNYISRVREELAQQQGNSGINPKANMQSLRIDRAYQKRDNVQETKEVFVQKKNERSSAVLHGGKDRD